VVDYGLRAGAPLNVLFASKAVFVGGQLLKGSRAAYEMATELGEILEWCGGSDLTIQKDVTQKEVELFAEAVGAALKGAKGASYRAVSPRIRLRAVTDAARFRGLEVENLTFEQKIVRTYASAVVILRRFFADLQESRYVLPRRIKRVAQSLVDLSEGSTPAFLGVTDVRNQNFDDAGRAVNTAILAVSMARELTDDRVLLAQIAMSAMMHDVGRPRAAALGEAGPRMPGAVKLSEDAEDKLAAGTAAVLTALGRVNEPTITRTVVAYEALWLRRERFLGPLYGGSRTPTVHSKIIQISRRYNDLVTPEPGLPEPQPDFAVATLASELPTENDQVVLRLLVATLNLLPRGTMVALTTNEVAEIIPSRSPPGGPKGTWVQILRDPRGELIDNPPEIDLTAPTPGEPERRVARVLSIDGWAQGLELIAEGPPPSNEDGPEPHRAADVTDDEVAPPDGRVTLELVSPDDIPQPEYVPEPYEPQPVPEAPPASVDARPGPASSSVPSIASILSLPGAARQPSNISDAAATVVGAEASYPSSGTSPSMVAQAMGRVMEEGAPRPTPERRPRSVALFEDPMIEVVAQLENLEPTARGTLTSTPIVHVLVYMLDHRQTGTVVLREPDGRLHVIYFEDGRATIVRNGRALALLGDGLVAAGLMSPDVLVKALEVARRAGSLLGDYLVSSGLVGAEALRIALSAQVPRKIERLVNLSVETDYAFYAGVNLISDWAKGEKFPCHPLAAILSAVRGWHDRARVRATLGRIAKQVLTFHPELDLTEFILTGEEQAVVEAIHSTSSTLSSLYDLRIAAEDTVSSIVYTFAVTRSFAFTAAKGPPMLALPVLEEVLDASDDIQVLPASDPPPAPEVAPVELAHAPFAPAFTLPHPTSAPQPFAPPTTPGFMPVGAIFGSPPASAEPPSPKAQAAALPRPPARPQPKAPATADGAWRPAKIPVSQVVDPVAASVRVPRPTEASPAIRSGPASVALRKPPKGDGDGAQALADFRMAEAALSRNEISQADELARKALAAEPTNADYGAMVAWTSTLAGAKDAIPLAIAKLNVILQEEPMNERALLYRGRLYKRAKRTMEALRDFSAVLDVNPHHAEAALEVRLLKMKKK
jgi:hypothetical protein